MAFKDILQISYWFGLDQFGFFPIYLNICCLLQKSNSFSYTFKVFSPLYIISLSFVKKLQILKCMDCLGF